MARYIFITGGVVSSLGKGLMAASLAALLQARGFKVRIRKFDPYLNVDPGTMSPYQHGEVYVTDDGAETDLDLGHYERFTGVSATRGDSVTTGRIYLDILSRERRGDYQVSLLHEWLVNQPLPTLQSSGVFKLLAHCTEKTALPATECLGRWRPTFSTSIHLSVRSMVIERISTMEWPPA